MLTSFEYKGILKLKKKRRKRNKSSLCDYSCFLFRKTLLIVAVVFVIGGIFIVGSIVNNGYELSSNPSMRNDRTPLNCAHYGGEWDTGGLFGEAKCVYDKIDESDNR